MELTDSQLLGLFLDEQSQAAFTELVDRHGGLVYHAALRRVGGDRQLAEDVAQEVFSDLARKASSLRNRATLAGWLYTSTRFAAAEAVRAEKRRQAREEEAETMKHLHSSPASDWEKIRPIIDDAMDELSEPDREAIILRFFEDRPFAEVGERFALSADASRMRIGRALEKLQSALVRRGFASTSAALATAMVSQSGLAAPIGLTGRIVRDAFAKSAATTATLLGGWKILACAGVGVLAIGLTFHYFNPREKAGAPHPDAVEAAPSGAPVSDTAQASGVVSDKSSPVAAADQKPPPSGADDLALYSDFQRALLKRLWDIQKNAPVVPGTRWGLIMGSPFYASDSKQADMAILEADDLVAIGPKKGVVYLTPMGIAFCRTHSKEIEAVQSNTQN
jgi:RNA polymerase sigma factor (sigma-70 family)